MRQEQRKTLGKHVPEVRPVTATGACTRDRSAPLILNCAAALLYQASAPEDAIILEFSQTRQQYISGRRKLRICEFFFLFFGEPQSDTVRLDTRTVRSPRAGVDTTIA